MILYNPSTKQIHLVQPLALRKLVKEEVDGGNFAVAGDHEIRSGVSRRFAGAAGYPPNATAIAELLRSSDRLISEVGMSGLDHARNAINLVASTVDTAFGVVEDGIFVEDIIDRCASPHGI